MSETIEDKLVLLDETISSYLKSLNLTIKGNPQFEEILNFDLEAIRRLTAEECSEYSCLASLFSLYIQTECNRHSAKKTWAAFNNNIILGKYSRNYGDKFTKFEERSLMCMAENEYSIKLNEVIKQATIRLETLNFLSRKIECIYQSLTDLSRSKRKYQ